MSTASPKLSLPFIAPAQAQKHITHNEALSRLDVITQLAVEAFDETQPPATPDEGSCYQIGDSAIAEWQGRDGQLAYFSNGGWQYLDPQPGWRAWGLQESKLRVFSAGNWLQVNASLNDLELLAINTTADTSNRLAVASEASLFNHEGAGHQMKINKNGTDETAALLFQESFSGRAEIGLVGNNDLSMKVSEDGLNFNQALTVRSSDGMVEVASLRSGIVTVLRDEVALIPTPGDGGMIAISLVNPDYPQAPHSALMSYDTGVTQFLVTLASGGGVINNGTSALDVASGDNGKTNLAAVSGGIQLQNRFSDSSDYSYTFLNTY